MITLLKVMHAVPLGNSTENWCMEDQKVSG